MSLRINDIAPDFTAETTQGPIQFHEWIGNNWAVLFSHPKDFTPVCTTELGAVAALEKKFADRGAKVIGLSVDPVESHGNWAQDIRDVSGHKVNYPIIGDTELKVAKLYDMLPGDAGDSSEGRTPALNECSTGNSGDTLVCSLELLFRRKLPSDLPTGIEALGEMIGRAILNCDEPDRTSYTGPYSSRRSEPFEYFRLCRSNHRS
jgi:peroxiredoxin